MPRRRTVFLAAPLLVVAFTACSKSEPTAPPTLNYEHFASVASSFDHTCAITTGGDLYCWGANLFGQLGETPGALECPGRGASNFASGVMEEPYPCDSIPHRVASAPPFTMVGTGIMHTCGYTAGLDVWCWGGNLFMQVGFSDTLLRHCVPSNGAPLASCTPNPTKVVNNTGVPWISLAVGDLNNMVVGSDDDGYVWGSFFFFGAFGSGGRLPELVLAGTPVSNFVGSTEGVCAIYSGFWSCNNHMGGMWGYPITNDPGFVSIVVGSDHQCGLTSAGAAFCWGEGNSGQLGLGAGMPLFQTIPAAVVGGHHFVSIAAGYQDTCAIDENARLWCWGRILSDPVTLSTAPVARDTTIRFSQITGGFGFMCGISTDQLLYCFGENRNGELGDGTTIRRSSATHVSVLAP